MAVAAAAAALIFSIGAVLASSEDGAAVVVRHPHTVAFLPGAYAALLGLTIGATIARGQTQEELGRGRGLSFMALGVLAALPVTLVIAAI